MKIVTRIVLFLLVVVSLNAQITPAEAIAGMGRGINLGNTLEPPYEGDWNNGPAQESHFDAYLDAGFSNIRIPVRWDNHTGDLPPFDIAESWMDRVEEVVDWGLSRGFFITLNGHHEDWLKNDYSNTTLQDRYDAIWAQIAERFKNKSERLLFEIINEPNGMTAAEVDELNLRILDIIRETNPTRIVIYGGNMYANSEQLLNANIPDDDYVVGYYHAYDPWQFSGQGQGTWGTVNDYQQLTNKYETVKSWSDSNSIPIHHSEFGAIHECDYNSRMRIYAHNVEQCIVNGFAFSVWDDGGMFGVLNRADDTWPEVKDILMHYYEDSPNQVFSNYVEDPITEAPTIVIDWNNRLTNSTDIIVERSLNGSSDFVEIASLPASTTTYTDLDVEEGKTYTYRMYTTRMDGTLLHGYPTRTSISATSQSPYNASPLVIPGVIEVEEYDNGGEGLAYHDNDPVNQSGNFRPGEGVDVGAFGGGHILGYVENGEWIEYTVNVTQSGAYSLTAEVASEIANGEYSLTFTGNNQSITFNTPSTGGWVAFTEISANGMIELAAGEQIMRLDIKNGNAFNLDRITFTLEEVDGIAEQDATAAGFTVSPNPSSDALNVKIPENLASAKSKVELYKVTGERVGTFSVEKETMAIDVSQFAKGQYLLKLVNGDVSLVHRVLIH